MVRISMVLFALMIVSCGGKQKTDVVDTNTDTVPDKPKIFRTKYDTEKFLGEYIGAFGKNTLIMDIDYINGENVSGYNIVKGNRRNIKGVLEDRGSQFFFVLKEPGTEDYDGTFEFSIDTINFAMSGVWTPFNPKATEKKQFDLNKRSGIGQPDDYSGEWFLEADNSDMGLVTMNLKEDGSGTGKVWDSKKNKYVEFRCSWIMSSKKMTIEWSPNPYIKSSKTIMTYQKEDEFFTSNEYSMYRYW